MDHDKSTSEDGSPDGEPSDSHPSSQNTPPIAEEQPSLIERLLGWSGNGNGEDGNADSQALGPAFRESSPAELTMVSNIIRLRELRVLDVMTPRADIVAIPEDATLEEVIGVFQGGSLSRLPVYRETLDDPQGFVHLKDLALNFGFGCAEDATDFHLDAYVRPALFVPPSMRIAALLQKMQGDRVHMALVIDEFGGVDGLVTIEDLVEQIVGDIEDEHDARDAAEWTEDKDGSWLVQARADVREFQEAAGLSLLTEDWEEEVDTMGGLVFMLANRVPTRGEVILHPDGYELEIVDADPRRIKRVRLRDSNGSGVLGQAAE
ncbi:MAG: hemolysin family protein [Pseudomonadota bacterium]